MTTFIIRPAQSEADFQTLHALFVEYADALGVDLCFQNFDAELADIAATYESALIAAPENISETGSAAGCVALKRLDEARCEMKRLYVRPAARGAGLGRRLSEAIVADARRRGYHEMLLDTLQRLQPAIALYEEMGFERCAPYYANPEPDVVYMRLTL